jgi:hypothetical protein
MKYVNLSAVAPYDPTSRMIDPVPYLDVLAELAPRLPAGARAFATDDEHYDFVGGRCVHDLEVADLWFDASGPVASARIVFDGNPWKHRERLSISYIGVVSLRVDIDPRGSEVGASVGSALDDLILDEVLPHPAGMSHEIAFQQGLITVVAADLTAVWIPIDAGGSDQTSTASQ